MNKNMNTWIGEWVVPSILLLDLKVIKRAFSSNKIGTHQEELIFIYLQKEWK